MPPGEAQMLRREIKLLQGQLERADQLNAELVARLNGSERPVVRVAPHLGWGYPTIGLVPTEAVAGQVWAGDPVNTVADDYNLTRPQVLIACWHEARHNAEHAAQWAEWLTAAEPALARPDLDWDTIPDPPTRGGSDE